jgi:hypothetical protein
MVFNATFQQYFSYIGGGYRRTHRKPPTCHNCWSYWQTWSNNVVHLALIRIRTHNISGDTDLIGSCKSNNHTITAKTAPILDRSNSSCNGGSLSKSYNNKSTKLFMTCGITVNKYEGGGGGGREGEIWNLLVLWVSHIVCIYCWCL